MFASSRAADGAGLVVAGLSARHAGLDEADLLLQTADLHTGTLHTLDGDTVSALDVAAGAVELLDVVLCHVERVLVVNRHELRARLAAIAADPGRVR